MFPYLTCMCDHGHLKPNKNMPIMKLKLSFETVQNRTMVFFSNQSQTMIHNGHIVVHVYMRVLAPERLNADIFSLSYDSFNFHR